MRRGDAEAEGQGSQLYVFVVPTNSPNPFLTQTSSNGQQLSQPISDYRPRPMAQPSNPLDVRYSDLQYVHTGVRPGALREKKIRHT